MPQRASVDHGFLTSASDQRPPAAPGGRWSQPRNERSKRFEPWPLSSAFVRRTRRLELRFALVRLVSRGLRTLRRVGMAATTPTRTAPANQPEAKQGQHDHNRNLAQSTDDLEEWPEEPTWPCCERFAYGAAPVGARCDTVGLKPPGADSGSLKPLPSNATSSASSPTPIAIQLNHGHCAFILILPVHVCAMTARHTISHPTSIGEPYLEIV